MNITALKVAVLSLIFSLVLPTVAFSITIHVPKDYLKIQDAINAASTGDTILVDQGIYVENIDFLGKDITVKSEHGPEVTIIDANMKDSGVAFVNGETEKAILDGFTITNGCGHTYIAKNKVGGGIYCYGSSPIIINNIIIDNKSNMGGGVASIGGNCEPEISQCIIADNIVKENSGMGSGGGIYSESGANINYCTIENNRCDYYGGGIGVSGYSGIDKPLIINNIIKNNIALSKGAGFGGGIGTSGAPKPLINKNIITGNLARDEGGINCYEARIINNLIINNTANKLGAGYGGGIITSGNYAEISKNRIINNKAFTLGGGICWAAYSGIINNNIICYNNACDGTIGVPMRGGGIGLYQIASGKTLITNCIITNNYSEDYGGGVCHYYNSKSLMINNTLYANKADSEGSGIYLNMDSTFSIVNSILYENVSDQIAYETASPAVTYCNIKGGWPGTGNIDSDPLFADPFNLDFHIKYNSPCRDAGDKTLADLPTFDFEKDPRVAYGEVDMGADEFYNHLYMTGLTTLGAPVDLKITGIPGTAPLCLCLSMNAKQIPQNTKWGQWYLEYPLVGPVLLGQIPAVDGIFVLLCAIPTTPAGPYDFHMQALIGNELSNCCTVEVK